MSFLSLCADSSHPPGLLHHQNNPSGTFKPTGSYSHDRQQCHVTSNHDRMSIHDITTYYASSDTAYPSINPLSFSLSCLHVISTLTSHLSWLPVYFFLSSWLQFSSFIILSIIFLVIPLPDLDNTHDNWQHESDNTWTLATHQNQPWYHPSHLACEEQLPWYTQDVNNTVTPYFFAPSIRKQQQQSQYISDTHDKWQHDYDYIWNLAMNKVKNMQHHSYHNPKVPLLGKCQQSLNNPMHHHLLLLLINGNSNQLNAPLAPLTNNPT